MSLIGFKQIIDYAIKIEEFGEEFYRELSEKFDDPKHKEFFLHLSDEEIKHKNIFIQLQKTASSFKADVDNFDLYSEYINNFASNIFNEAKMKESSEKIKTIDEAIDFACRNELDTILFYQEIKPFVENSSDIHIDALIKEERVHYNDLIKFKNNL